MDLTLRIYSNQETYAELIIAGFARDKTAYDLWYAMKKLRREINGNSNIKTPPTTTR